MLSHLFLQSLNHTSIGKCPLQWESDVSLLDHVIFAQLGRLFVISNQEVGTVLKGEVMNLCQMGWLVGDHFLCLLSACFASIWLLVSYDFNLFPIVEALLWTDLGNFLFLNMSRAPHPSLGDVREYLHTELGFIIGRCYWQMVRGDQGCHSVSSYTSMHRTKPQQRTAAPRWGNLGSTVIFPWNQMPCVLSAHLLCSYLKWASFFPGVLGCRGWRAAIPSICSLSWLSSSWQLSCVTVWNE